MPSEELSPFTWILFLFFSRLLSDVSVAHFFFIASTNGMEKRKKYRLYFIRKKMINDEINNGKYLTFAFQFSIFV